MSNRSTKNKHQRPKRNSRNKNELSEPVSENLIYGLHAIQAALEQAVTRVEILWIVDERDDVRVNTLLDLAQKQGITPHKVEKEKLDEMVSEGRHQGAIAQCRPLDNLSEIDLFKLLDELTVPPFLLILDGVQDPHNLGACMRTAEAAGVHAVIAPKDRSTSLTHTALKVSSGAAERLPFIQVTNLARVLRELKESGIWLVGTSGESEQGLFDIELKGPLAIILGAEGRGIRRLTRENCDQVIFIPMQGGAESLNVSVAAGVTLFEAVRQRNL